MSTQWGQDPYGPSSGRYDPYGSSASADPYGSAEQHEAADPYGTADRHGTADPYGGADPYGAADPHGAPCRLTTYGSEPLYRVSGSDLRRRLG